VKASKTPTALSQLQRQQEVVNVEKKKKVKSSANGIKDLKGMAKTDPTGFSYNMMLQSQLSIDKTIIEYKKLQMLTLSDFYAQQRMEAEAFESKLKREMKEWERAMYAYRDGKTGAKKPPMPKHGRFEGVRCETEEEDVYGYGSENGEGDYGSDEDM